MTSSFHCQLQRAGDAASRAGIEEVRQGKFFEISFTGDEDLEAISREVLSNPVIEDYRIEKLS